MSDDSLPQSESTPAVGNIVDGRYRIDSLHAEGGMSTVFRATHLLLERPVAFKVVSAEVMAVPGCAARFLREARAATQLRNDHIVQVFDVGVLESGAPYMVMEWLEGGDLAQLLVEQGALPLETAIEYVLQVCETLAEVHGRGIIHRDLKPSNLFVTTGPDGSPHIKLLDFGVSKMMIGGEGDRITQTGTVLGSPSYMAPEQMGSAESADERTDVWGAGTVLFELLTGRVPFEGQGLGAILKAITTSGAPKVSTLREDIPAGLDDVVARCLQAEPADRFPNVVELAQALAKFGGPDLGARAAAIEALFSAARLRPLDISPGSPTGDELRSSPPPKVKTPMPAKDREETIAPLVRTTQRLRLELMPVVDEVTVKNPPKKRSIAPMAMAVLTLFVVGLALGTLMSRVDVSKMNARGSVEAVSPPESTVSVPRVSLASAVVAIPSATSLPSVSASASSAPAKMLPASTAPAVRRTSRWADLESLPSAREPHESQRADELFEERK